MPAYAIGLALSEPDTADQDRWDRLNEAVRDDEGFMEGAHESVSEDLGDWPQIAALLADLSGSRGLIRTLSVIPGVSGMSAHHLDQLSALARLCDRIADEREKCIAKEVQSRFDDRSWEDV